MSLFKRLFSTDYRAALAAEAAGHLEQAAEHYALAGERAEAARVHMARADRAVGAGERAAALRDALHWVDADSELERRIYKTLGRALLDEVRAQGIATQRDHQRVREAAEMLGRGGDHERAGDAYESIGDVKDAIAAYSKGGLVERVEMVLQAEEEETGRARLLRDSFANYEVHMRIGDRDAAREDLRASLQFADKKAEIRRLLDDLESRLITGGVVTVRERQGPAVIAVARPSFLVGRDPLCELSLRTGGISRHHAEVAVADAGQEPRFLLRDAGSKNHTLIAGLPVQGAVPLLGEGAFSLGEHCSLEYRVQPGAGGAAHLVLRVQSGMDRGLALVAGGPDEALDVESLSRLPVTIVFRGGRPILRPLSEAVQLSLNGENVAQGEIQLIHGDQLVIDGREVEVA